METLSEALAIAVQHHQEGRLQAAEQICRQILAVDPERADALHLLGVIASRLGRQEVAVECIQRAIALTGNEAVFHSNLGAVFRAQGNLDEAVACCRRALELKPDSAAAHYNLGCALQEQGKLDEAVACFRQALKIRPDYAEAHNNLGTAFLSQGKLDEAVVCFRLTLELKPDFAVAHYNLGTAFQTQGQLGESVESFLRALVLQPDLPEGHHKLGTALQAQGKLDQAVACFRRALELKPNDAGAHSNLGTAFKALGKDEEAAISFRRAVELRPDWGVAHYNLGTALQAQGEWDEAVTCFQRALDRKTDLAEAHNSLGTVLSDQGRLDEAVSSYGRALELKPDFPQAHNNLLLAIQYRAGANLSELAAAHAEYERLHAAPLRNSWLLHENDRDPERRLRVGFVSRDFGQHPVGYFLIRALENLDRARWETVYYSDRPYEDYLTARLKAAATIWRDVSALHDKDLAEQIRADRIDILFDLAGHTAKNRLLAFARKPAPIQVTWAGYVGTTGLAAMDYILADRYEIPPGAEAHYCERVLRMPDGYVCYDPPLHAPLVSPLPSRKQSFVTLGSFNNRAKITSQVFEVWAKILIRVPQSRLLLKHRGMNHASIAKGVANEFASHGIDPRRVECLGWSPHVALLDEYNRIDLALDTFPYNGGLTTCEALWMGVPVITCPGETFAGRHALSHLSTVGLTETIARDLEDYVELAVSFANDLPGLAALRAGLRERMAASPLCDGKRFAGNLMVVLRDAWREWCQDDLRG